MAGDDAHTAGRDWLTARDDGNRIDVARSARVEARVEIDGPDNRLVIGDDVVLEPPAQPGRVLVSVRGRGNTVRVGAGARVGAALTIEGDGCTVDIGAGCKLQGFFNLLTNDAHLGIGDGTTMVQASVQLHEPGSIRFGRDCMVSTQVYVSLSDIHPIYDRLTGERINAARSVSIGDHVWLGLRSMVMKGATIGDGSIVAAGAMVTGSVPAGVVVAGSPARILRRDVVWRRDFTEPPPAPEGASPGAGWMGRLRERFR